ncbi:hypothetical protein ACQBAU_17050 [Propionibacteriaceae bacterium Y2011]|uniref:hypothetical protein n=1 Tax=Microlunatus sp. Y2014 TaxID=3418488 RepID=UPI003B441963
MTDQQWSTEQRWSDDNRDRFTAAAARVTAAIERHVASVAAADADTDEEALARTAGELEAALSALSHAELALSGACAFWLGGDELDEDEVGAAAEGDAEDAESGDGAGSTGLPDAPEGALDEPAVDAVRSELGAEELAVLVRMDFNLDDRTDLLAAAAAALQVDPADLDFDPEADVESAIFAIAQTDGWDRFLADEVPGLLAEGAVAEIIRGETPES